MLRLESAEIRNSLEGKTRARSLLQGSREVYRGNSCLRQQNGLSILGEEVVIWGNFLPCSVEHTSGTRVYGLQGT